MGGRRWGRCVWVQRKSVGLPMKQWYHFVYIIVGGVHRPGVCIKRCRRVRCERVCYAQRPAANSVQRVRCEESCVRDQRAPRELSSRSWTQERAILDWTDPSAKIFSQRFDDATKPDGRRECRVLFVYRMNDTCKTRHGFFFSLGGLDRWII